MTGADLRAWMAPLAIVLGLAVHPVCAQPSGTDGAPGSTVIGDEEEAAIGLFLRPWREEAMSDIDRPPRANDLRPEALTVEDVEARIQQYERLHEFQRTQTQRR